MTHRITFVHAPEIRYDQNYGTLFSPLWAYTLAAHVPAGWDVTIVDSIVERADMIEAADVFGFSGINQDIESIREVHDLLKGKFPDATFILGGPITWSLEQEGKLGLLEYFDRLFILDGERTLPDFLNCFDRGDTGDLPKIIRADRFPLIEAKPIRFDFYRPQAHHYYGALVEVSRGCPFLCEFCDIRVLPGNNRSHTKAVDLIIEEIDAYFKLGVTQFQFACDNFIGDIVWARECVDAIIAWKRKTGAKISIFTWLTINLYKMPDLMANMREAGFSILFIGIESVNRNSLLETAKVQNSGALKPAVLAIQSYGFIIAPGFIFGFDSDTETVFDDTLEFLIETGTIGGDPSFLTALPGTPLFARMRRTGRLVERDAEVTTREKITTNILYLQDAEFLANGFIRFMKAYTSPKFQLARFRRHLEVISQSENFVPNDGVGYGSPREYLKLQLKDPANRKYFMARIGYLLYRPTNFIAALRGWWLMKQYSRRFPGLGINFNYWVYVWTNMGLKYWGLKRGDISLRSVDADFDISSLIEAEPVAVETSADGPKAGHQARYTDRALKALVADRLDQEDAPQPVETNDR
jgi:radical SAM superfamily enzyme YgiQ (UPF0313 family)